MYVCMSVCMHVGNVCMYANIGKRLGREGTSDREGEGEIKKCAEAAVPRLSA